jgi:hypothetical protein
MATEKQKTAARQNIKKAQAANRGNGTTPSGGMSTRKRESLGTSTFAFPKERKEPLNDASHVRNAIARFDQVEGVSDAERDQAWRRIKSAAKKHDVEVEAESWRELTK